MAEIDYDLIVNDLIKSKDFEDSIKKVLVKNSKLLGELNEEEQVLAAKLWFEYQLKYHFDLRDSCDYVIDNRYGKEYYARNIKLNFENRDHFNLIRNLMEHFICQVHNATHPLQLEDGYGHPDYPAQPYKGRFTDRQYKSFFRISKKFDDFRLDTSLNLEILISQFEQDLILEMIEYYLNFPEKNWYTTNYSRISYQDLIYDLQYLHDLIENL
jgi:hypothetical protein